jgi:hypothetical protein
MSSLEQFQKEYVRPNKGRALIVGSKIYRDKEDRRKRYADAVGVDMLPGDGVDVVCDLENWIDVLENFGVQYGDTREPHRFDHVECMSTLEHSRRPWIMAENIQALMKPGASIFVSVPFCWRIHAYPDDYWRLTPSAVRSIFPEIEWQHVMLAADVLRPDGKIPAVKANSHPYMARTETVAFGHKRK